MKVDATAYNLQWQISDNRERLNLAHQRILWLEKRIGQIGQLQDEWEQFFQDILPWFDQIEARLQGRDDWHVIPEPDYEITHLIIQRLKELKQKKGYNLAS